MNSTLKSPKTATILSRGVPGDRVTGRDSQSLPEPGGVRFGDQSLVAQAIHTLRFSDSVAERVSAAHTLGDIGSELATADLIASLFDQEREVIIAAAEALSAIADPAVNLPSLYTFFSANGRGDECLPVLTERSIQVRGNQALMVVEPLPPHRKGSTVSDLHTDRPLRSAPGPKDVKTSRGEVHLEAAIDCFDDPDPEVRNATALAVSRVALERSAEYFALIMEMATPESRRRIGRAMVDSGLATEAIEMLNHKRRERVYNALGLLSLLANAGEIQPLVKTIEEHSSTHIRRVAVKVLSLSGQGETATAAVKRRLKI